uniref:Protein MYG1 putative n=1 Tax=Albugo laibachii Nc14 TaxID=890382 RepID=F0WJT3_9STRA|nr:protein MYG1 putative [Albugo laibachii Nc14]|eukprot:CCA21534.1 protein MYG1 putative [Albugo laibachii Nc14]
MARPTTAATLVATSSICAAFRNTVITSSVQEGKRYIGTHHGSFHCDEALAVSLLKLLPKYKDHDILRTREPTKLGTGTCDAVADVGGVYEPNTNRFDHHQQEFNTTFSDKHRIKLSSAGLVYKHYGRDIIQLLSQLSIQPTTEATNPLPAVLPSETVDLVYEKVYTSFIEHIDGIDNGVGVAETSQPLNYQVSTTLSSRVGYLNPSWNDPRSNEVNYVNSRFQDAMYLTVTEFIETVIHCIHVWLPARSLVEAAFQERLQHHPSGRILYFPQYCPWKSHLYEVEEAHKLSAAQQVLFVIYHENTENTLRVQAVNTAPGSFALRKSLNEAWRGLRGEELSTISGIPNCVFVHNAGFIGGNKNFGGALSMAVQSLPNV